MREYLNLIQTNTLKIIEEKLSKKPVDFDKKNMPEERGIYFIYEKQSNDLVYIGCSHAMDRNIKKRCSQYLGTSKKGATFRNKVIKDKLKKDAIVKDKNKKEHKNSKAISEGIEYIQNNYRLKFITVDNNVSSSEVQLLERACISLYNPKYND